MPFVGISERLPTGTPEISPQRLVVAYDMRSLTPSGRMKDLSGYRNDGTLVGTTAIRGPFGPARRFREASDFVELPRHRSVQARGPVSIAVWMRLGRAGLHQHVVAYDDLYTLWIDHKNRIHFADTRENAFDSEADVASAGEWFSLVASFAGRPGTVLDSHNIALYLNGEPVAGDIGGDWSPGRPVQGYVGKEPHDGHVHRPLMADIAGVLIFRRPLSAVEAKAFAEAPRFQVAADGSPADEDEPDRGRGLAGGADEDRPAGRFPDGSASGIVYPALGSMDLGDEIRAGGEVREIVEPWGQSSAPGGGTREPPRVVRITNILPPYRLRVLEILHASPLVRFETWLMAASERNRRWDVPSTPGIRTFRDWGVDLTHRGMMAAHFNPGMIRELSAHPPDLVILGGYENPTCVALGFFLDRIGIPFLLSSESISLRDSLVGRWAPFLVRKLVQKSAGVIVPGLASREHLLHLGADPERTFIAPNSLDAGRFAPARSPQERKEMRRLLRLPDGTVCLYVGRLTEGKGILDLLEAFGTLQPAGRNLHLVIVGEGPLRATIESLVAADPRLNGCVSLVGYAEEDLLPKYYAASDIFVFPTWRDIWGFVLNEAMSAGLAVVTTDKAAAAYDLIDDGVNGVIVRWKRPRQLADAIKQLAEDPELRRTMGAKARERMLNRFTPPHQASGFLNAVMTTLERSHRPALALDVSEEAA